MKINVDASIPSLGPNVGSGVVVRNHMGDLIGVMAKPIVGWFSVLTT